MENKRNLFAALMSLMSLTSKMAKALVRREKQNRSSGSPIEPEVFSAHIASICSSGGAVERRHEEICPSVGPFEMILNLQS